MQPTFILSCESTIDLPYSYVQERELPVLFYSYSVDGEAHVDDMGRDPQSLPRFYQYIADGKLPSTSQLNEAQYEDFFAPLLEKGDVLHIAFGSGMTASVQNAKLAAEVLREKYPERKLVVIDSLCSSSGYGLLVDAAADMRDAGKSLDETAEWVTANCNKVHHQFYSTELKFYRRSGRMSGATATIATILDICPIMRLDDKGKIIAYGKVRGKKNAVKETICTMEQHAQGGVNYSGKCFICHSNCPAEAEATRQAVAEHFPHIQGDIPSTRSARSSPRTAPRHGRRVLLRRRAPARYLWEIIGVTCKANNREIDRWAEAHLRFLRPHSFLSLFGERKEPPQRQKKPAPFRFHRGGESSIFAASFFLPESRPLRWVAFRFQ